jgi:hypothetical protein
MKVLPVLLISSLLGAEEPDQPSLGISVEAVQTSRYMAHGFNASKDSPAFQPSLTVATRIPGISVKYWGSYSWDRDKPETDEHDLLVQGKWSMWPEEPWAMDFNGYIVRWIKPNSPGSTPQQLAQGIVFTHNEGWKTNLGVALPEIASSSLVKVIPAWNWYRWFPITDGQFIPGSVHEVKLACIRKLAIAGDWWRWDDVRLTPTLNYHTGVRGVEPGWSHTTVQAATSLTTLGSNFTAAANYQRCWESTVNPDQDTFWWSVGMGVSF